MAYIGVTPSNGVRRVHTYTATASQQTFTGAGAEGVTLSYKDSNFIDVYQNGVKLGDADYTATSGTSVVLGTGAAANDLVVIVTYDVFSVSDTVSKADGGTFDGNVTMGGTLGVTGAVTANAGVNIDNITIDGTEIDLSSGDLTIDVAGDINIDAGGGDVNFKDDSTQYGFLSKYNNDLWIGNTISDGDVAIRGKDGSSNITAVTFDMSSAGAAGFNSYITSTAVYGKDDGNTGIQFDGSDVITLHTGGAERMKIDASGRITKASNPSFRAMGTTASYQTTSPVPFPSVTGSGGHNVGSHYNTSNYRFTAPVTGRYLMHVHMGIVRITANSGNGYPYLRINSSNIAYSYVHVPTGTAYHPANVTQIFFLNANDYVDVIFGGGNSDYYGNYTELSFSGCLLS